METALSLRGQQADQSCTAARRQLADRHDCHAQYFTHAAEGRGKNAHRLAVVHTVMFTCDTLSPVIAYIRDARRECRVRVECVYEDGPKCNMLYASGRYIKQLGRAEGRALRARLVSENTDEGGRYLAAVCTGRRENMSCVYTYARRRDQQAGKDRETQEDQGGPVHIPVQVQASGTPWVPANGKGPNLRD